ncbi:AcrR family transcriptional regulator [Pullulanibacillus pueri]|uniref:TetR family transcriptional regulator n=2 Tax=Pullulanibacillus pueri TaxID=1437324 RepID=A0A8J2ZWE5_9BACL|nr:AcrR family transcriptional regulator [Pullulanibacillus pueri]GGH82585.1 TetR family transcriptional regulator [Pullulanibacillus pueri]
MKEALVDKRSAALKATLALISEQGFHGTPMSQIAERANIGIGTIYRYFKNKEDLINALYIEVKKRMAEHIFNHSFKDTPVEAQLKQYLIQFIRFSIEHPQELNFTEQYENSPLITEETRAEAMRVLEPLMTLFQRAVEQRLLKAMPIEMLVAMLGGSAIALAKLYLSDQKRLDEHTLEAGVSAIWDLIKK